MKKRARKSWTDKLETSKPHQVKPAPMDIAGMKAGEIMLVPSPQIIADFIRAIPPGASMDVKTMRQELARKYKAEVTCPITTGILLRIVAEVALEARARGAGLRDITPFWRVLDEHAPTTRKLSCGAAFVAGQRRREGI